MTPAGQTITAMSAGDVTFPDNQVTLRESLHMIADKIDNAHKLMADRHRHGDGFLRPGVPVIYMYVGPADRCFGHTDEHVVTVDFGNRDFLQPESGLGFSLYDGLHRFVHEKKLGESGNQERRKTAVATAAATTACVG